MKKVLLLLLSVTLNIAANASNSLNDSNIIYQTGTINSLINKVYDGDKSISELKQYGDFGLGTVNNVAGEVIVLDGKFYCSDPMGNIKEMKGSIKSPFIVLTKFKSGTDYTIKKASFDAVESSIISKYPSQNYIYAIKITGKFSNLKLRSEKGQPTPYQSLSQTLPQLQNVFTRDKIDGTIVGVWFPSYMSNLNVSGFHFHFIDKSHKFGGHVLDFTLNDGTVELEKISKFQMDLIDTTEFANANLDNKNNSSDVKAVEKLRQ